MIQWSKELIVSYIQEFYLENNKVPTCKDFNNKIHYPTHKTVTTHFGSWNKGLEAAGLTSIKQHKSIYSKESIIEAIKLFYTLNGKRPTRREFTPPNYPSSGTVSYHFGSWNEAIKAAELEILPKWTKESIIASIRLFYSINSVIPSELAFTSTNGYPSHSTVQKHFVTWNAAIEAAGFEPTIQTSYGVRTKGLDGHLYRSMAEAYFVDNYLYGNYEYVIEPKYPYPHNRFYDWYIPEIDLYVELDGEIRPEITKVKILINQKLARNCRFIKVKDLYKKGFKL